MLLLDAMWKLALALFAGGLVGLERERRERPAGLRTHILVCVGSALITLVSIHFTGIGDPSRIASNIVTGIGFLGAGTIFRYGSAVRGLTTAAGIWVVAGIGMGIAVGGTLAVVACGTAVLVYGVNRWVRLVEDRMQRQHQDLTVVLARREAALGPLFEGLERQRVVVERVEWLDEVDEGEPAVRIHMRLPRGVSRTQISGWLASLAGVREIAWEE